MCKVLQSATSIFFSFVEETTAPHSNLNEDFSFSLILLFDMQKKQVITHLHAQGEIVSALKI